MHRTKWKVMKMGLEVGTFLCEVTFALERCEIIFQVLWENLNYGESSYHWACLLIFSSMAPKRTYETATPIFSYLLGVYLVTIGKTKTHYFQSTKSYAKHAHGAQHIKGSFNAPWTCSTPLLRLGLKNLPEISPPNKSTIKQGFTGL